MADSSSNSSCAGKVKLDVPFGDADDGAAELEDNEKNQGLCNPFICMINHNAN